jgi:DNA replication licensing factor MCM2
LAAEDEVEESYEKMMTYRRAAEEEMDVRDTKRKEFDLRKEYDLERLNKSELQELEDEDIDEMADEGGEKALNLEAFECPLRDWIAEERTRREIQRRFKKFLLTFYHAIDDVAAWFRKNEHLNPMPPLPSYLKVYPPLYPPKIRLQCFFSVFFV